MKKFVSLFISLLLVLCMTMPLTAFAEPDDPFQLPSIPMKPGATDTTGTGDNSGEITTPSTDSGKTEGSGGFVTPPISGDTNKPSDSSANNASRNTNNNAETAFDTQTQLVIKKSKITKLVSAKKAVTVNWKKILTSDGYQLQYATNKKFTKNKKTTTVKKNKTVKKTVKKLTSRKKYYFRIRTYKLVDGKKQYSDWSAVKTVTVK